MHLYIVSCMGCILLDGRGGGGGVKAGLDFSIARYPVEANGVTNVLYMGMYSVQEVHNQWYMHTRWDVDHTF